MAKCLKQGAFCCPAIQAENSHSTPMKNRGPSGPVKYPVAAGWKTGITSDALCLPAYDRRKQQRRYCNGVIGGKTELCVR